MIEAARERTGYLIVIVNNDTQQLLKKGRVIQDETNRARIVRAMRAVDDVLDRRRRRSRASNAPSTPCGPPTRTPSWSSATAATAARRLDSVPAAEVGVGATQPHLDALRRRRLREGRFQHPHPAEMDAGS